jgi:hypothetical protein
MGACLFQINKSGKLKLVAYFSKKLSPAKSNYEIHDKGRLVQWSFTWFGAFSSTGSNPVATHAAKIF